MPDLDGITTEQNVLVSVNPYEAPAVDVTVKDRDGTERVYTVQPINVDQAGFDVTAPVIGEEFARHKDTATDKAIRRMDREAYATESLEDAAKARRAGRPAYESIDIMADVDAQKAPLFFPVRGSVLDTFAPVRELPPLTIVGAAMRLKRALAEAGVAWEERHMEMLMRAYPNAAVPEDDLKDLARRMLPVNVMEFEATPMRAAGGAA